MKKLFALAAFVVLASPFANAGVVPFDVVRGAMIEQATNPLTVMDVINWKVGDTANYNLTAGMLGSGTSVKSVTKDEGTSIWVEQAISISGQNQTIDMQLNKADGKILKLIENGQEQSIPDETVTIISQDYTSITVPAGTFKVLHVVGKSAQSSHLEVWTNPRDTVMDGAVKESVDAQMGITMVLELTSFKKN